jgi:zinc transporter ZupT
VDWKTLGDVAFYVAAVSAVLFALLYLVFAPWWKTETGRNIMAVMGSLAAAMGYFAWVISRGGVPGGFYPVRALLFLSIAAAILWRVTLLVRTQLLRKPKEGNKDELEDAR